MEKWGKLTEADIVTDEEYWEEDWDGTYPTQQNKNFVELGGVLNTQKDHVWLVAPAFALFDQTPHLNNVPA